MATFCSIIHS